MDCSIAYFPLQESEGFVLPEAFLQQLTPEINLLFLCNPNNPTGRTVSPALLQEIWKRCEEAGILLVVDECFNEFLEHPEQNTLKGVLKTGANSVILKAFTKSFAMPGLRLGYGLCGNGDLAERIFSCGQPWGVSIPAQAAGVAALQEQGYLERMRRLIQTERRWLSENLARLGLCVFPSEANYIPVSYTHLHEFHYWESTDSGNAFQAEKASSGRTWPCIHASGTLFAGFPHIHFCSNPRWAQRFLEACVQYEEAQKS